MNVISTNCPFTKSTISSRILFKASQNKNLLHQAKAKLLWGVQTSETVITVKLASDSHCTVRIPITYWFFHIFSWTVHSLIHPILCRFTSIEQIRFIISTMCKSFLHISPTAGIIKLDTNNSWLTTCILLVNLNRVQEFTALLLEVAFRLLHVSYRGCRLNHSVGRGNLWK